MKRISTAFLAFLFLPLGCGSLDVTLENNGELSVISTMKSLPATSPNKHYPSNREPLLVSPLVKLPIGAITPRGWLRGQLELMADGMTGRLTEISEWCRAEGNAWISPDGQGHSPWEELPYWLKGFGDLGYVLKDQRITAEARVWIEGILSSQEEDGWFGPRRNKEHHDIWPNMVALNCLQSFHEATGDERVLPFMTRYFRWQLGIPREFLLPGSWQKIRGGDNLESIYWLYNRTGEPFLLDLAIVVHERTVDWTGGIASWHGVNICQGFREPGEYYIQSKKKSFLDAAYRNYDTVIDLYGQQPGGMFGADENCRQGYFGPRQAAETCSMVEFMHSFEMLFKICGDPLWADRCEEVAFNSLPASMTSDLKALHYLTAPNMVQLDGANKSPALQNRGCMLAFSPHRYRCCQHNVAHGWPYYAEELWLATADNGLLASLYAPSTVTARVGTDATVTIKEDTDYPFDENIRFTIATEGKARFPLYVRIPRWCRGAVLSVNGKGLDARPDPLSFVRIDRYWSDGDRVDLCLPMTIDLTRWEKCGGCISVSRGPLSYSLQINERWEKFLGDEAWQKHERGDRKSSTDWPAFEVYPTTPWNYGLVLDEGDPAASFEVVLKTGLVGPQPFVVNGSPVELRARARRIPNWRMKDGLAGAMQSGPVRSEEPEEKVILIPMGCARLRISAFPVIGTGSDARQWTKRNDPLVSHCFEMDTPRALNDGIEPASSGDRQVPRMTWWDHKGTEEWAAYEFETAQKVSWIEIYWFDDTGRGHCRVPASWRLYWLGPDGKTWQPVAGDGPCEVELDRYNRFSFAPVEAKGLKIVVQLKEEFSGGILEWKYGE